MAEARLGGETLSSLLLSYFRIIQPKPFSGLEVGLRIVLLLLCAAALRPGMDL